MNTDPLNDTSPAIPWRASALGAGLFLFLLLANRQYGFHGDELYFIVCGANPAWGYVDHPPFVPMVARVSTALMGTNLFALRFPLALTLGLSCALTGLLARRMGGGALAEIMAAISFVCAPMMMRLGAFLNIPCFEVLFWLLIAHVLVTLCRRNDPRWWLAIGVLSGIALLNKHTTLFLGAGMAMGILLTQRRKDLMTPWPWLGLGVAFLLFLPNLLWQMQHDWATLEFVRNLNATVMQHTSRAGFILAQLILYNPVNLVLWLAAFYFFFKNPDGQRYRMLGWIFLTVLCLLLAFKAKVYYLLPAYPILMAGGAAQLDRHFRGRGRLVVHGAVVAGLAEYTGILLPIMTPVGDLAWKDRYVKRVLGFAVDESADLTFDFHYQLQRHDQVRALEIVYAGLSERDREHCIILAKDYDTASAVNVLGDQHMPHAISGNNTYYLWGPGAATGECVIATGFEADFLRTQFQSVKEMGEAPYPWLDGITDTCPIYVCRSPVAPLDELWPAFKLYR